MKKLMTLMLGLAFLTTTVVVTFAQDTATSTSKTKKARRPRRPRKPRRAAFTKLCPHLCRFGKPRLALGPCAAFFVSGPLKLFPFGSPFPLLKTPGSSPKRQPQRSSPGSIHGGL